MLFLGKTLIKSNFLDIGFLLCKNQGLLVFDSNSIYDFLDEFGKLSWNLSQVNENKNYEFFGNRFCYGHINRLPPIKFFLKRKILSFWLKRIHSETLLITPDIGFKSLFSYTLRNSTNIPEAPMPVE